MSTLNIMPIRKEKVSDEVFRQILNNIKSGFWSAGMQLPSENTLCKLFNVSRVSVRTAIHKLEAIGMLETRNGEGTFVKEVNIREVWSPLLSTLSLTNQDVIYSLEFRRMIECQCSVIAANRCTDEDAAILSECIDKMQYYTDHNDVGNYSAWDTRFHISIIHICQNPILDTVYNLLCEILSSHIYYMNEKIGMDMGMQYHKQLLEAIREHDGGKAGEICGRNIDDSIDGVSSIRQETP